MNQVTLLGRITQEIDLKYLPNSGQAIAKINIATNKKDKDGKDKPMFIECVAFGRGAEIINQYFKRGSRILIQGELEYQTWQNQNGQKMSKHIVIINTFHFIDQKDNSAVPVQNPQEQARQKYAQNNQNPQAMKSLISDDVGDDMPF